MLKIINRISEGVHYVKKVSAIISCFSAALNAWHDEWLRNFPNEIPTANDADK